MKGPKIRILICGILPPPYFGHSMMYKILMDSKFTETYDVIFLNLKFWSYQKHKRVTLLKLIKLFKYYAQYVVLLIGRRPHYVLYGISFDKMPFLKDVLFCMTGRLFGAKIILHDMGQYIRDLYEGSTPLFKKMMRWFMSSVSASIVLGESPKQLYGGFLVKERVLSVPGSVSDSRVFFPGSPKSHHGVNVLFFSFLSVSKGLLTALEAVPVVVRENPDVSFTFVGPIESQGLHDQMEEFIKKHNIQDRIEYVGYVGDEAKRTDYLRNADIFIFPTHRDVFGLVLLHAMAEHLPVVASFEGSIPEIIDEGQGGFLFSKGDASALASKILLLAKDPQRRREMGDYNRQKYLLEYTPERFGQKMIRAFQEIQNFK